MEWLVAEIEAMNELNKWTPTYQSWSSYCVRWLSKLLVTETNVVLIWYYLFLEENKRPFGVNMTILLSLILEGPAINFHGDTYASIPRYQSQSLSQHHYLGVIRMPNSQAWIPLNTVFIQGTYFQAKEVRNWAQRTPLVIAHTQCRNTQSHRLLEWPANDIM